MSSTGGRAGWRCLAVTIVALVLGADAARGDPAAVPTAQELRARRREATCRSDPRVALGLVSERLCVGAELFFRETFGGNGRTCGTCHPAQNNFTLDPEFIATLPASDPLFVSEQRPELAALERPALLRAFGLIVVNADGFDDPTHRFVVRSVPHTLSLATSLDAPPALPGSPRRLDATTVPPKQRTGWSGDGAPGNGELLDFSDGAIRQHATRSLARAPGVDFVLPSPDERQALTEFMLGLGRQRDLTLTEVRLNDPAAERGRRSFLEGAARDCNSCHDNAGANAIVEDADLGLPLSRTNFSFDIGTERDRPRAVDEAGVPFDGGFGTRPFDSDGDGIDDAFGNRAFNTPPLIEAADTGPFFHTHAAQTIEDAIRFYTTPAFGNSLAGSAPTEVRPEGGPFQLTETEIGELGRFLRVLNAAFNCEIARARLDAALRIHVRYGRRFGAIQERLLELGGAEIEDALSDLAAVPHLNPRVQQRLREAFRVTAHFVAARGELGGRARRALQQVERAQDELGTGLRFEIGASTLLF